MTVIAKYIAIVLCVLIFCVAMVQYNKQTEESWRLRYCIDHTEQPCPVSMDR